MDKPTILLSICIPTFKRGEILEKTLESIYSQLDITNIDKVEVIVTDNDPEYENEMHISRFKKHNNFNYHKNNSIGFLNSLEALKMGKGALLKLHNIQMIFKKQSINNILKTIETNKTEKPILFFSNGVLNLNSTKKTQVFDQFIYSLSYQCSWSAGFSLWGNDIDILNLEHLDKTFPQTSLLFALNKKSNYVIDDTNYCSMQFVKGKGGYNVFKVFGSDFLDMIKTYANNDIIKINTFEKIRKDLSTYFFPKIILKNIIFKVENFETKNCIKYLDRYYSRVSMLIMFISSFFVFRIYLKNKFK
jgi:abequosyltransferase